MMSWTRTLFFAWAMVFGVMLIGSAIVRQSKLDEDGKAPHFIYYFALALVMSIIGPIAVIGLAIADALERWSKSS